MTITDKLALDQASRGLELFIDYARRVKNKERLHKEVERVLQCYGTDFPAEDAAAIMEGWINK